MSKKTFRTIGKIAAIVGAVALVATGIGAALGGTMVLSVFGTTMTASAIAGAASLVSAGASMLSKPSAPKISQANQERLTVSLDPRTPRKMVFGRTAMATDLRDQEYTGGSKEYLHRFIVVAAHKVNAVQEIWFDDQLAWTSAGGVTTAYAGFLTVTAVLEGAPGNAINISARLGASRRFTGLAYVYLRFKLTGNTKKTESPFAQQVPTRLTIVGEGMPCYDARQDSTVPGGAGAHRAADQTTWTYGAHARNPACQLATSMLGWRIRNPQSGTWKLSVGAGTLPDRFDWPSFIEGANLCDEAVALAAGGTEPRYRGDGMFDEAEGGAIEGFRAAMNADVDDQDGLIRLTVFHNDLATIDADFTEADVEDDYQWRQTRPRNESFNVVRGSYIEPDPKSLYQPAEYREVSVDWGTGIDRAHPADFGMVQSKSQSERLAKQRLQREQYSGEFRATFLASGWKVQKNSVVRFNFAPEGFVDKLFRVAEYENARPDGRVPMVLVEENAQIYAWDAEEGPAVQIAEPTYYAPGDTPVAQFLGTIEEGATVGATAAQLADIEAALALAAARGRLFFRTTAPSAAESAIGDTWINDAGVFHDRVGGSIVLGGFVVTLGGFRPGISWTRSAVQPLEATIATAAAAYTDANDAIDQLIGLADDGTLSINEKITKLIPESARLAAKWTALSAAAATLGVSTTAASAARTTWLNYLAALLPAWNDIAQETAVTRATYDANRNGYDEALYQLDKDVKGAAKALADAAQSDADAAQATADTVTTNFNSRNDRLATAVVVPTIAADGTAVDHAINAGGSANLSFEWIWGGTESEIDGFEVLVYASTTATAYAIGTTPAAEQTFFMAAGKRAFLIYGVDPILYYTFAVRAYRVVDGDVNAAGILRSAWVKSALAAENPYRPASSVAFAGDVTGTINGAAAATVASGAAAANNGLNADGTIKANKVLASSLDGSVVHEIVATSASAVAATDAGAVLVSVANVTAKPSQGGRVVILLTADCVATTAAGKDYHRGYGVLQRSPAGTATWTQVGTSWRMFYLGKTTGFVGYSGEVSDGGGGWKVPVVSGYAELGLKQAGTISGHTVGVAAANQWIDTPPSDGDYDYRVLFSATSVPGTASVPEAGVITASTAEMVATSIKVAQ